jgi:hypothetical protein
MSRFQQLEFALDIGGSNRLETCGTNRIERTIRIQPMGKCWSLKWDHDASFLLRELGTLYYFSHTKDGRF